VRRSTSDGELLQVLAWRLVAERPGCAHSDLIGRPRSFSLACMHVALLNDSDSGLRRPPGIFKLCHTIIIQSETTSARVGESTDAAVTGNLHRTCVGRQEGVNMKRAHSMPLQECAGMFHTFRGVFALKSPEIVNHSSSFLEWHAMSVSHVDSL
jgi:hypothetical protein